MNLKKRFPLIWTLITIKIQSYITVTIKVASVFSIQNTYIRFKNHEENILEMQLVDFTCVNP
jgi:hypothetical protein